MRPGIRHTLIIIIETGFHLIVIQIEILGLHGRGKGADGLAGSAPQSGHHIQGEREGEQAGKETGDAGAMVHNDLARLIIFILIVGEAYPANQIGAQQGEQHNP